MVANAQKTQEAEQESANNPPKNPWLRQEGEPILWFNRFHRYRDLGTKRSLLATLEQERRTIKVQKSTKSTKKSGVGLSEKTPPQAKALKAVPPSKQVPGSWKQASITWRWVERAKAYVGKTINSPLLTHKFASSLSLIRMIVPFLSDAYSCPNSKLTRKPA